MPVRLCVRVAGALLSIRGAQTYTNSVDCQDLAAGLSLCPELEQLVLHNMYLNHGKNIQVLAAVSKLHSLSHIDLRGSCVGEATVAQLLYALPQLPRLRTLLLGINSLYGAANQALAPRLRLPRLLMLPLGINSLSGLQTRHACRVCASAQ